jgi:hypothetical protein
MKKSSDWLSHQSRNRKRESGISVLDLLELPPKQRRIMRVLLRRVEMTYSDLCEVLKAMPEVDRVDVGELEEALDALKELGWLTRTDDQDAIYRVNLRRKAGSRLSREIWPAPESKTGRVNPSDKSKAKDPKK